MPIVIPHVGGEGDEEVVLVDVVHDLRLEEHLPDDDDDFQYNGDDDDDNDDDE